jgi:phytoene desaturase
MKKIGIIGAGIGGIALAIRAAYKGYEVDIFDKNPYAGGKLAEIKLKDYRFDAGPSLFTQPELVDELFELHGKNPRDYFNFKSLPTICHYFWEDGTHLKTHKDPQKSIDELSEKLGEERKVLEAYFNHFKKAFEVVQPLFLEKSLHKITTWTSKEALKGYLNVPNLGIHTNMNRFHEKRFKNPKTTQLFNRYATYNGSDPYQTPATLTVIPHLEYHLGAYFPEGGMVEIVRSLVKLAKEIGVRFHLNEAVEEIFIEKGLASGFRTNKDSYTFNFIGSNSDITPLYKKLFQKTSFRIPKKLLNQEKSSSGIIFYWGIKQKFQQLGVHNIFFSENYKEEFSHIFKSKTIYFDPTIYLHISSKVAPNDAPPTGENWFLLMNTPHNIGQDWDDFIAQTRTFVLQKLERMLGVNIEELIEQEDYLDPRRIEDRTSSAGGALYGNSSNNPFAAFLRHPNFSKKLPNMVWVGGSVHPGGGIPLSISSAKIASEAL